MLDSEVELKQAPDEGITKLRFSPSSSLLLVSSWDKTVRLYNYLNNTMLFKHGSQGSVLDCCFLDTQFFACGNTSNSVELFDIENNQTIMMGFHDAPVKSIEWCPDQNLIVSGSWDSTIRFWDPRSGECVANCNQPERVFTMDKTPNHLIVGTASRHVWIWDIRRYDEPEQRRESPLRNQIRCIKAFPDGSKFSISSMESRVAIAYIDPDPIVQKKKFAFKCHRHQDGGIDLAYPVHALTFHPKEEVLLTGGGDGYVNIWDCKAQKKMGNYSPYESSISSLDFSPDGRYIAIASSYCFEEGEKSQAKDRIFVREVGDEIVPKGTKKI